MHPSRLVQADPRRLALGVFALAFLWRLAYLLDIQDNPFFTVPVIDAELYHAQAVALAQGSGLGSVPFIMPPLFTYLLGFVYRIFGVDLWAAHVLQILLGSGSAALTFLIGRRVAGPAVGLVAAAFVVTSKTLLYLEGDLLATPLCIVLDLAAILALLRWLQDGERRRDLVAAGVALGLSALALPLVLVTLPGLVLWLVFGRRRAAAAGLLVVATLVPIAPVTLRNLRAGGELVPISANGGINFYLGNNPDMRRLSRLRPGPEWRALQELPVREAQLVEPGARDRWFLQRGLRFWAEQPLRAVRFTAEKALLLVHDHELMRDFDFYWFRDHYSTWLRLPGWSFAWLFALALLGLVLARGGAAGERLLGLWVASYAAGVVLFFVTARYRAPLVPLLAVFAAQGLVWLVRRVRDRDGRALAPAGALFVAALALSYADLLGVDRVDEAEARYRVATTVEKRGELGEALRLYDEVLGLDADHPLAAARAALCAQLLGRSQEAVDRYETLLERHPDYAEAALNLANLAWKLGEPQVAQGYFDLALEIDPYLAPTHASLGLFRLERGDAPAAVLALRQALVFDPAWEALRIDLARALVEAGQAERARQEIEQAAAVLPPSDRLELVRGDALRAAGRPDEARLAWERGLQLNPANTTLQQRLARQP